MKCPNCGGEIEPGSTFCGSCGSQISLAMKQEQEQLNKAGCPKCGSSNISFNREKLGEQKGKKGTDILRSTVGVCKDCGYTWQTAEPQKKRKTWLWVLGWIFIFPLPLTLILLKKNNLKPIIKYIIIAIAWILYLVIAFSARGSGDANTNGQNNIETQQASSSVTTTSAAPTENNNTETTVAPIVANTAEMTKQQIEGKIGNYIVTIKDSFVTTDYEGSPVLVVTYSFTNNDANATSFSFAISDKLFQNGIELGDVYSSYGIDGYNSENSLKDIQQGVTLDVQSAYKLNDTTTDVEVQLSKLISFSDETLKYIITLS